MRSFSAACLFALLATASPALSAEGMWLPRQAPEVAKQLKDAGLALDPAALSNLNAAPMNAIASLGGCSASFVSPQGLVATNHHCVYGSIQYNSKPGQDYLTDGFLAKTLAEEAPAAPGSRVFVIEDLRDVTRDMMKGVTPKLSGFDRNAKLEDNRKALIAACEKQPNRRCDVRPYFGGSTYFLQQQLELQDVRLVYAPAGAIGNYGGEVDNWQWPRHTGDFGFYRAYVAPDGSSAPYSAENVPYKPKAWLKIAQDGVKDGDFVMVAGFPGTTERHRTAGETKAYYERIYPRQQKLLAGYSDQIMALTAGNEDATIKYASILRGTDNYKKKIAGQLAGAEAISLQQKKAAQERAFRAWATAEPKRAARLTPVVAELDKVTAEAADATLRDLTASTIDRAQLLSAARELYRWAKEREKPDVQREPGYQNRDRRLLAERLTRIERRFVTTVDRGLFEAALVEYRTLPADDRNAAFERTLGEIGLDRLYAGTKLGDTQTRLAWMDRPAAEFERSTDPFIRLAVAMYPEEIAGEHVAKDRAGRLQAARSAYMAAYRDYAEAQGQALYPDANGSLRFTWGKVTGRARDGMRYEPFTTAAGIVEKDTGREPFNAPRKQLDLIAAKNFAPYASPELGTLPVNFLSTVDITNGNSGSATLNSRGEFVGLAFDGTIEGIISDWWFDDNLTRTIHVDSRYMRWVMDKIDGADRLLTEMGIGAGTTSGGAEAVDAQLGREGR
jgi:hypothetical protein